MSSLNQEVAAKILADKDWLDLKCYIITTTGLSYFAQKDEDLAGRIARRFAVIGMMPSSSYKTLLGTSTALGSEFDLLINELTIGETYFFRHSEQFDALRKVVLPKLIEKNQSSRRMRIWCAGCSTGAEPYTLSIILRHEFRILLAGWTIEIVGTDINRSYLARAREGHFDDWHLRTVPEDSKKQWFRRADEGRGWLINEEFKQGMTFQHHNLISGRFPPQPESNDSFDLILCRNVMIYFSPETVSDIMPRFEGVLATSGYLFLGYSEINTDLYKTFQTISYPGALLFQKRGSKDDFDQSPQSHLKKAQENVMSMPLTLAPGEKPAAEAIKPKSPPIDEKADDRYIACRKLADTGDYEAALKLADAILKEDSLDSYAHYIRGVCQWQLSRLIAAEDAFKKAIYIDRKLALAHYHLGMIYRKLGDMAKAERYLSNTADLIKASKPKDLVAEREDITVQQLSHLIKTMRDAS